MHYDEFPGSHPVSPEIELAASGIASQLAELMDAAPERCVESEDTYQEDDGFVRIAETFEGCDITTGASKKAAFYSAAKDRTAVITSMFIEVNVSRKRFVQVDFYKGAPFGHFFVPHHAGSQFIPAPNRQLIAFGPESPEEIAAAVEDRVTLTKYFQKRYGNDVASREQMRGLIAAATPTYRHVYADTLRTVSGLIDMASGSVSHLDFGRRIIETTPEDSDPTPPSIIDTELDMAEITSMKLWLKDVVPLDIL